MALSNPKLHLLSLAALFLMLANIAHSQDTTTFAYNSFNPKPDGLTYQGDANVQCDSTDLHLTRTNYSGYPQPNSVGRVLYSKPIHFWDCHVNQGYSRQASFETNIYFTITLVPGDPAEGLTFFIVPVGSTIPSGSGGANFGLFGPSGTATSTVAVEFDNYVNREWDPSYRHIGIDINSRRSINVTRFDGTTGQRVHANIYYDAPRRMLTVVATVGSQQVSLEDVFVNLGSILPEYVQVGISASTGTLVERHQLSVWQFNSTLERESLVNSKCLQKKKNGAHI